MFPALLSVFRSQDLQQHRQQSETNNQNIGYIEKHSARGASFFTVKSVKNIVTFYCFFNPKVDIMQKKIYS